VREDRCKRIPALLGLDPLQVEGLGHRLTGHRQLQGHAPWVERCFHPWRAGRLGTSLQIGRVGEDGRHRRGHERGMQARLQGAGPLGVNHVEAVHRRVQLHAEFDLPAHPIEVSHLSWADPGRKIGEEEAMPFRSLDADEAQRPCLFAFADMHISVNGPAVQDQDVVRDEGVEVSPPKERLGDLSTCDRVDLGLPVIFEADHKPGPHGLHRPAGG
jgi:hypothetical protein